ncbi:major facilitator superfamily domain-containing protein [Dipodascopsis tothii]|uniref:major facilitator superfamily domain-containing protein n=1 Tax=Dipodascopsis tothii TaxID=44089 RepID=UPI0034CDE51F
MSTPEISAVVEPAGGEAEPSKVKKILLRFSPKEEHALVNKIDWNLMPLVKTLFILAFLDRSNIGNARIAGLEESFNLSSNQYDWLLTAFYISYFGFEWIGFLWNIVPAHIYVAVCIFGWGFFASLQSAVTNYISLFILRFILGIGEASFGPGVPMYLSFFYQRKELGFRTGLFMSAAPLSTAFAGTLAYFITKFADKTPIDSWRVLLFVEGLPSMAMALVVWHYLPDRPSTAKFLNLKEKILVRSRYRRRIEIDGEQVVDGSHGHGFNMQEVFQVLQDPKVYVTSSMFFLANIAYSSMPVFLPVILREMGYESITAQGMSAPPYIVAYITVIAVTFYSDKKKSRAEFIVFFASMACAGYVVLAVSRETFVRYLALFFVTSGFFTVVALVIAWTVNNQSSESAKGTGVVMLNTIGQCGPIVGTRLYPDSDGPYYPHGMGICALSMLLVAILAILLRRHMALLNAQSEKEERYNLVSADEDEASFRASTDSVVPSALDADEEYDEEDEEFQDEDDTHHTLFYETISQAEARQLREQYGFDIEIIDDDKTVDDVMKAKAKFIARKKAIKFKYML